MSAIAPMVPTIETVTTAAGAIGTAMTGVAGSTTIDIMVTATITGGRIPAATRRATLVRSSRAGLDSAPEPRSAERVRAGEGRFRRAEVH